MSNQESEPHFTPLLHDLTTSAKRELFAAMAMQGIITGCSSLRWISKGSRNVKHDWCAEQAVKYADALLAALKEESK